MTTDEQARRGNERPPPPDELAKLQELLPALRAAAILRPGTTFRRRCGDHRKLP